MARTTRRGCLLIVAAAGYGKTTALENAGAEGYYRARELLAVPADLLRNGSHLAVDDVSELSAREQVRLGHALAALPDRVRICLAARHPLGPTAMAALPGPIVERGPSDLALAPDEVARVLRDEHGIDDADIAYLVHDLTAGWPALVQLAGDALARRGAGRGDLLAALTEPGTAGAIWIREHAVSGLPSHAARLLDASIDLDPISATLLRALPGSDGRTLDALNWLTATGFLAPCPRLGRPRTERALRLVPAVAAALRHRHRESGSLSEAAAWYAANGHALSAARAWSAAGNADRCAAILEESGDEMLAAGGAAEVTRIADLIPDDDRTPRVQLILADALRMAGDATGASKAFAPLLERADRTGGWEPSLVWRASMLHYMRADYRGALDVLDRAEPRGQALTADDVHLLACRTSVYVHLGETDRASASAARALDTAAAAGDDRASAAAHLAAAFTEVGARRDRLLTEALAAAERAGDVIQQARVLANQADRLLREARYPQALDVAARAIRAAELGGPPGILATALHNAGEALTRLGRYEVATLHFERSMRISCRAGLNRTAAGLCGLGEVHRQLGRREQGRAAFEEAAELARGMSDLQILVPSLVGLARLLVDGPGADLDAARQAADEAERLAPPDGPSCALVARGRVALFDGDLALARERAAEAVRAARTGRHADALAEALELTASATADSAEAQAALQEAAAIWRRAGAGPAADQMLVLLGRIPSADEAQRAAAKAATKRLLALGVEAVGGSHLLPAETLAAPVRVRVLGGFEVLVGGRPVPLPAWRSRQARTLLKILIARRGRPVPRGELCELLWPDDEPQRTGHRLSVLLSVVRNVLDPTRLWPADHVIRADLAGVSLDIGRVTVDVEDLLRDAAHGARLARDGAADRARELLGEVDAAYRGDAFDDEPYEDWADGLREHARAAWLGALRDLADLCRADGDTDSAATALVRLLVADGFDESAHRALVDVLVRAGRHGEARRAFDRWTEAMRTIDAPLPDRGVLHRRAVTGRSQQG